MKSASLDIAAELTRLEALTNFEVRGEWRRLHAMQPPKSLSRDLLLLGITYKMQERSLGGLSKSVLRKIADDQTETSAGNYCKTKPRITVKPGTRLIREWHGVTHAVLVLADGVEWRGKRYRSLSIVAREITGAHWSGPRFFGLTSAKAVTDE